MKAADVDDTGSVDLTDAVYLLNYLFIGGAALADHCGPACLPLPLAGHAEDLGADVAKGQLQLLVDRSFGSTPIAQRQFRLSKRGPGHLCSIDLLCRRAQQFSRTGHVARTQSGKAGGQKVG